MLALMPLIMALAPLAAKAIGSALGGGEGKRVAEQIEPAVTEAAVRVFGTTDEAAALHQARRDPSVANEFAKEMAAIAAQAQATAAQLRIAEIESDIKNVQDARAHQQKLVAAGSVSGHASTVISIVILVGFFGTLTVLVWRPFSIDAGQREVLQIMLGALTLGFGAVINYWLGSSHGSKAKDNALVDQARNAVDALRGRQVPPVVVAQPPNPVPAGGAEGAGQGVSPPATPTPAAPAQPAPPGLLAEVLPALMQPHSHFPDSVTWALTPGGISIDGAAPVGTPGEPVTIRTIWQRYGDLCSAAARRYGVPVELIVATIATESRGNPQARRQEPQIGDASTGLMQTLRNTAREALGRPGIQHDDLFDPALSIEAGTAYIAQQRGQTHFDPPLVAAAYNAGSIRLDEGPANRWKLRCYPIGTGEHVDRFVAWFSDCMRVSAEQGWGSREGVPSFAACLPNDR